MMEELEESIQKDFEQARSRLSELRIRSSKIEEMEGRLSEIKGNIYPVPTNENKLKLNIGGKCFSISKETLNLSSDFSGFKTLLSGKYDHLLLRDRDGRIFFDFDYNYIKAHIEYCRDLAMWDGEKHHEPVERKTNCNEHLTLQLKAWSNFFSMPLNHSLNCPVTDRVFSNSKILHNMNDVDQSSFVAFFPQQFQFKPAKLLYHRGSLDSIRASDLHRYCAGTPNTVIIIRDTEGNVFGGYASQKWYSKSGAQSDTDTFLFSIAVKGGVCLQKHSIIHGAETSETIHNYPNFLCAFGKSSYFSMKIKNDCNVNKQSYLRSGGIFNTSNSNIDLWKTPSAMYGKFTVHSIEVFQLLEISTKTASDHHNNNLVSVKLMTAEVGLARQESALLRDARCILEELQLVTKCLVVGHKENNVFVVVAAAAAAAAADGKSRDVASAAHIFESVITEIQSLQKVIQSATAPVTELITIDVGGTLVTTTKDTLRQAPEGSPLANMASDAWGHDLDSDGNIYQDVNSELFVAIINHLRLKQLFSGTGIQVPPIVVYEEQKTALDNLLAFYMLTDLPVHTIQELRFLSDSYAKNPRGYGLS